MTRVSESKLHSIWWVLRFTFGLVPFLAGLDKFFNILTDWTQYLSPIAQRVLPVSPTAFMHFAGVIEMIVGIGILTQWTQVGSYVASVWLVAIAEDTKERTKDTKERAEDTKHIAGEVEAL